MAAYSWSRTSAKPSKSFKTTRVTLGYVVRECTVLVGVRLQVRNELVDHVQIFRRRVQTFLHVVPTHVPSVGIIHGCQQVAASEDVLFKSQRSRAVLENKLCKKNQHVTDTLVNNRLLFYRIVSTEQLKCFRVVGGKTQVFGKTGSGGKPVGRVGECGELLHKILLQSPRVQSEKRSRKTNATFKHRPKSSNSAFTRIVREYCRLLLSRWLQAIPTFGPSSSVCNPRRSSRPPELVVLYKERSCDNKSVIGQLRKSAIRTWPSRRARYWRRVSGCFSPLPTVRTRAGTPARNRCKIASSSTRVIST